MGIYIKGMGIPKNCWECPCDYGAFGECVCGLTEKSTREFREKRRDDCLISLRVPAPHGRLIDADALMKKIEHDTPLSAVFEKTMRRYLHNAPTIIPAEEEP